MAGLPTRSVLAVCLLILVPVVLTSGACSPTDSGRPDDSPQSLAISAVTVRLAGDPSRTAVLPQDALASLREQYRSDADMTCLSINFVDAPERLWIPLRMPDQRPRILPGGAPARVASLELQTSGNLPSSAEWFRVSFGEGREARLRRVSQRRLLFQSGEPGHELRNLEPDGLVRCIVVSQHITINAD